MRNEFTNASFTDFSLEANRVAMQQALAHVQAQFSQTYPLVIGGQKIHLESTFYSYNPSQKEQVVGTFPLATVTHAEQAIQTAYQTFSSWSKVPPQDRAEYLFKAAEVVRRRRFELNATLVYEVGKSWAEADGDVAEAIDFLEFYGREMLRYAAPQPLTKLHGEDNELVYLPMGVTAVIPPWNFPFAILVGMSSAAIVTGNPVVLKPAEESPLIGYKFVEIMEEVGLPPGVLNFLTGDGAAIGGLMVNHPLTRLICFTGSKDVGLLINEQAAKRISGQKWLKRVIAEMGGKDSIIVDTECDLDTAVAGVVASAFGFQGQKCSACSRAIVLEPVYDDFISRLVPAVQALQVGAAEDPAFQVGPVISAEAEARILGYIAQGQKEGHVLVGGAKASEAGYFIQPTVIADVAPKAVISQEEIFGPVLAVLRAADFADALNIVNNTDFGLTGAVYSHNEDHLKRARAEFFAGNLYLNRKCTGAMVGAHPFGGFNLSGTDSKAGGRDYLLLFLQAKSIVRKV